VFVCEVISHNPPRELASPVLARAKGWLTHLVGMHARGQILQERLIPPAMMIRVLQVRQKDPAMKDPLLIPWQLKQILSAVEGYKKLLRTLPPRQLQVKEPRQYREA
jgi:hypothetical protein